MSGSHFAICCDRQPSSVSFHINFTPMCFFFVCVLLMLFCLMLMNHVTFTSRKKVIHFRLHNDLAILLSYYAIFDVGNDEHVLISLQLRKVSQTLHSLRGRVWWAAGPKMIFFLLQICGRDERRDEMRAYKLKLASNGRHCDWLANSRRCLKSMLCDEIKFCASNTNNLSWRKLKNKRKDRFLIGESG